VLRNVHLLFGLVSLPFLLMFGVSSVQMAHSKWFNVKPQVSVGPSATIEAGLTDAAEVTRRLALRGDVRGKLPKFRVVIPGIVHEVTYVPSTGVATVSTSRSPFLGVLNRLHHAAGLWPNWAPLRWWGAVVGLVSLATIGLAVTGIWMWWARRQDRVIGLVLLGANALFAAAVLAIIRSAGP
jgi:hypothetical protein